MRSLADDIINNEENKITNRNSIVSTNYNKKLLI